MIGDPEGSTVEAVDLSPIESECLRCHRREAMRVPGLCVGCRDELAERFAPQAREVEVAPYEPTMHITPNAVALKDD